MTFKNILSICFFISAMLCEAQFLASPTNASDTYFSGGNVGIGTTTPTFKLTVEGEVGIVKDYPYLQLNSTSWNAGSYIQTGVTTAAQPGGDYMVIYNPASKGFNFRQGTYNALTILPSGNIGIGNNSPLFKFTVAGEIGIEKDYPFLQLNSTSWNAGSFIQTGVTTAAQANGDYMVIYNPASKGFNFRQGSYNAMTINPGGSLGIGTTTPTEKLEVNGTIRSKEVKVEAAPWPDYVFADNYQLTALKELEAFIQSEGHLPEVPSAKEVEENGIALGEMNALLLKKIEELTLHTIGQQKEINKLKSRIENPTSDEPMANSKRLMANTSQQPIAKKIDLLIEMVSELKKENEQLKQKIGANSKKLNPTTND